ncbi:hypothetical protein AGMMS49921_06760 [Endomicrobiia bacterium]|nr:hypothetical protein AGMMS49921_06760 [Endomicrobiia bacterium]
MKKIILFISVIALSSFLLSACPKNHKKLFERKEEKSEAQVQEKQKAEEKKAQERADDEKIKREDDIKQRQINAARIARTSHERYEKDKEKAGEVKQKTEEEALKEVRNKNWRQERKKNREEEQKKAEEEAENRRQKVLEGLEKEREKSRQTLEREREELRMKDMTICGVCLLSDEDSLINIKDHTHIVTACESCKQLFHTECIKAWMKVGNTCPECRKIGTFGALSNHVVIHPLTKKEFLFAVDIGLDAGKAGRKCLCFKGDVGRFGSALEAAELTPKLAELLTCFDEIRDRAFHLTNTADLDDLITKFIDANVEFVEIKPRIASIWSRHFTTPHPLLS